MPASQTVTFHDLAIAAAQAYTGSTNISTAGVPQMGSQWTLLTVSLDTASQQAFTDHHLAASAWYNKTTGELGRRLITL